MTTEEKLDRLTGVVETLTESIVSHDDQIEALIKVGERHEAKIQGLHDEIQTLVRQWQAYINTLRPQ